MCMIPLHSSGVCVCMCVVIVISSYCVLKCNWPHCSFSPQSMQLLLSCDKLTLSLVKNVPAFKIPSGGMTSVMWLEFRVASLLKWCPTLLKFWEDMDLRKSPDSLQVDGPDPHPFACVMLYSGASLWQPPRDIHYCPLIGAVLNW